MQKVISFLRLFRHPLRAIRDRLALIKSPLVEHPLRNGLTFWTRPGSSDLMSVYDIFTSQKHSDYLSQFKISPGETVVDIGANIGVFTLQAAKAGARVIAYEPIADTFRVMLANIAANNYGPRITPYRLGVDRSAGHREIFLGNRNHSMSCSFYPHENTGDDAIRIQTIGIAEVLKPLEYIDLLKIDCEGAEFEFLPAAAPFLHKVGKIVLEYHEIAKGFDHRDIVRMFRDAGFQTKVKPWKPGFGILYAWRGK